MNSQLENKLRKEYGIIAGIDEAGRGPWAGPVVAACVILPTGLKLPGLNDSKKINEAGRERLYELIMEKAEVGIGMSSEQDIDDIGLSASNFQAMQNAVKQLSKSTKPKLLLIDGRDNYPFKIEAKFYVKGDSKMRSIAAASIIAKVTRDRFMKKIAEEYPQYGFEKHKGYGTRLHQKLLKKHGASPIHRKSFQPVWDVINQARPTKKTSKKTTRKA